MEQHGARLVFPIDVKKKPWEQKLPLHNRWHPDIPPVAAVTVGELFRVEMVDFSGGRITKEYSAEDIKNADPSIVSFRSYLTVLCVPVQLLFYFNVFSSYPYVCMHACMCVCVALGYNNIILASLKAWFLSGY
ncbi:FORMAMIDASE-RELATED [Salix viminalis]|uniref:FORMAMIDASE-RELATED n=1 Tax=Salix viminalis TaxID=40686 RepID=A0A9Q0USI6_SALVM|nr:FORMAMIDASE-RELATED [Salix viminalis]